VKFVVSHLGLPDAVTLKLLLEIVSFSAGRPATNAYD